ncbi:acetoin utilization protein [Agaricicola taiwanensis]|uniref:Acetoin utilization protein n=1 Tax=Agaricicola taiwanensis TaxID=591372 RepID=A0A8J2VQP4_9RHOB|nr:histone deacetylase family protein [Agaricicola taiwanensis]GGE35745.1 acetoin utilization protein [Agaricicola taiwanensis]
MATLLVTHEACLDHKPSLGHPERPDRLRAVAAALSDGKFSGLERVEAPLAPLSVVTSVHTEAYAATLDDARPREGMIAIDGDTVMSPGTWEAALRGVGAARLAVDRVMEGSARNAFCAIRPPGHHAERQRAMGFCFFNNAAIAARHAQNAHGAQRVAIMDFDVHHGNGTQDIFWSDESVLFTSTHQMPLYPGTGASEEKGEAGTIVNVPLKSGDGGAEFRAGMEGKILPAIDSFRPDIIIISAGFDAHERDPLGGLQFTEDDFGWATMRLMELADRHGGGRVVSVLEGGYDLDGLARSAAAHVAALMQG